ncbi:hypothetical protein GUJ93_ZPchr0008g12628 [Zizania palustris]|uniref:TFIIS N-terminal domain-containing protein n=1 Tax=Zizania palustris TaxID=103762 RepID=A0A8J5R3R6_ZIZPA|nr:hypothetical protein GUJ93_ZPchr0008g12628 [Zizania palustris]
MDLSLAGVQATGSAEGDKIGRRSSVVSGRVKRTKVKMEGTDLYKWRKMFCDADIYDVIDNAILIAAADSPKKLRRRRDDILQLLFAVTRVPSLAGSHGNAAAAAATTAEGQLPLSRLSGARPKSEKKSQEAICTAAAEARGQKNEDDIDVELKEDEFFPDLAASDNGGGPFHEGGNGDNAAAAVDNEAPSLIDHHMAEMVAALAVEIEKESEQINEVLRIKDVLINYKEMSVDTLFDGLRRLQLMRLSVEKLKSTEILSAVAQLKNHRSPNICELVSTLTDDWKGVAGDWVNATSSTTIANNKSDTSSNMLDPSAAEGLLLNQSTVVEDDFGLPIPPMDVGAFLLTQSAAMEHAVSELLLGLDDDGNVMPGVESNGGNALCDSQNNGTRVSNAAPAADAHVSPKQETEALQPAASLTKDDENKLHIRQDLPIKKKLTIINVREPTGTTQTQASEDRKVDIGTGKKDVHLTGLGLEETKRKLNAAYQEAVNVL